MSNLFAFVTKKSYGPPIVMGNEKLMKKKAHGSTDKPVQENLRWNVSRKKADKICSFNRHYAENSQYFVNSKVTWLKEMKEKGDEPTKYYDSVSGKHLYTAPIGRTFDQFLKESKKHGWPSFRDAEVNWENVRVLKGGETVSVGGTHLGHNLADKKGNRYCINLVCVAGNPVEEDVTEKVPEKVEEPLRVFQLQKDEDRCTGLFYRSNPNNNGRIKTLGKYGDWPRDDALVKGAVYTVDGKQWLKVEEIQQPHQDAFVKCLGEDVWLPFKHEQYSLVEKTDI